MRQRFVLVTQTHSTQFMPLTCLLHANSSRFDVWCVFGIRTEFVAHSRRFPCFFVCDRMVPSYAFTDTSSEAFENTNITCTPSLRTASSSLDTAQRKTNSSRCMLLMWSIKSGPFSSQNIFLPQRVSEKTGRVVRCQLCRTSRRPVDWVY